MNTGPDTSHPHGEEGPLDIGVDADDVGVRLDRFLRRRYPRVRHALAQKLIRRRAITVNGQSSTPGHRLQSNDVVGVRTDLSEFRQPTDGAIRQATRLKESSRFTEFFRVIHEDDCIIALGKPSGIVVHPSRGHHHGDTLLDLLRAHLPAAFAAGSPFRPAFVHRLDRGTSGIIVAAKTVTAARSLERSFRERRAKKTYLALVRGNVTPASGVVDLDIQRQESGRGVSRYRAVSPAGRGRPAAGPPGREARGGKRSRRALTRYRVIETFLKESLLSIEPGTGRTHQIRAHLAATGHPVCGDGDYGNRDANRHLRARHDLDHTFLHAAELEFPHPETGEPLRLAAPLPAKLERILAALRKRC